MYNNPGIKGVVKLPERAERSTKVHTRLELQRNVELRLVVALRAALRLLGACVAGGTRHAVLPATTFLVLGLCGSVWLRLLRGLGFFTQILQHGRQRGLVVLD